MYTHIIGATSPVFKDFIQIFFVICTCAYACGSIFKRVQTRVRALHIHGHAKKKFSH